MIYIALIIPVYIAAVILLLNPFSWISFNRRAQKHDTPPPYRAVSLFCEWELCSQSVAIENTRFLLDKVPQLPLTQCNADICVCRYVHHADRRIGRDRREVVTGFGEDEGPGRRGLRGRRKSDWSLLAISA